MQHFASTGMRCARLLPAVALLLSSAVSAQVPVRSIDGSGNNIANPDWGRADTPLLRLTTVDYFDLINSPAGSHRASAREISNLVCAQAGPLPSTQPITDFVWQWGQFVDHDIDLTGGHSPPEPFPILVPLGDPFFDPLSTGTQIINLFRSLHVGGISILDPRQQVNQITAYLDGSAVYGSDQLRANALRTLDGTGKLRSHLGMFLPFNDLGLPNAPDDNDTTMFLAGDVRANEQVGLTALHTLFLREHNYIAGRLAHIFPSWQGARIYRTARALVGAEMQKITYDEWLPLLLGPGTIPPYSGYDPALDASIANCFSTALYRFGHTMLSPELQRLDAAGNDIPQGPITLRDAFFNPDAILNEGGIDPLIRGLADQRPQEMDPQMVDDVRNFLFGPPGAGGFDLAALNIQRGRDHGLPGYNLLRMDYGLAAHPDWPDVTSDAARQAALSAAYATPDDIDAWVGGLAEDPVPGALVGELVQEVLRDQFERIRDGDRFWWESYLQGQFKNWVDRQTLAKIIRRNTSIGAELQDDVFIQSGP